MDALEAVRVLLRYIGENPDREGLKDTPARVLRALAEMTAGYKDSPQAILSTTFEEDFDEIIAVKGIDFVSLCEHHVQVFSGVAHVGYLPSDKGIVGLSKLARLVDCYARRLQVQERMTKQIADDIMNNLQAKGVGVIVEAYHSCLGCRGAKKPGASMKTSVMLGVFRDNPEARAEFMSLIKE